jgi:hypothetical protein
MFVILMIMFQIIFPWQIVMGGSDVDFVGYVIVLSMLKFATTFSLKYMALFVLGFLSSLYGDRDYSMYGGASRVAATIGCLGAFTETASQIMT